MRAHFILYVREQDRSTRFYEAVLQMLPTLNVPGMTEFHLREGCILGLMPEEAIHRLLGERVNPTEAGGAPRAEVYLVVERADEYLRRALQAGAELVSPLQRRSWGHLAGYFLDPDSHVVAFAEEL